MRCLVAVLLLAACSGDDAHKQTTMRSPTTAPSPAGAAAAADAGPHDAATAELTAVALTEAMAAPYWTTPDEVAAAQQFALERWQPALTGFETALAAAMTTGADDDRKARIRLMIG